MIVNTHQLVRHMGTDKPELVCAHVQQLPLKNFIASMCRIQPVYKNKRVYTTFCINLKFLLQCPVYALFGCLHFYTFSLFKIFYKKRVGIYVICCTNPQKTFVLKANLTFNIRSPCFFTSEVSNLVLRLLKIKNTSKNTTLFFANFRFPRALSTKKQIQ